MEWQPISTAPLDNRPILIASADEWIDGQRVSDGRVTIGRWYEEGTSWVDENGNMGGNAYTLKVTGAWAVTDGWLEPVEVTHWMPLPPPPVAEYTSWNSVKETLG